MLSPEVAWVQWFQSHSRMLDGPCNISEHILLGKGWRDISTGWRRNRGSECLMALGGEVLAGVWTGVRITVLNPFLCLRSCSAARLGKASVPAFRPFIPFYLKCLGKCPEPRQLCPRLLRDPCQQTRFRSRHVFAWMNMHLTSAFLETKKNLWFIFFFNGFGLFFFQLLNNYHLIDLHYP